MNVNSVNTTNPNFKGYLKFRTGQYINSKHITSILYDRTELVNHPKFHSAGFMMSDGLNYIVSYKTKPAKSLFESMLEANKSDDNIVNIDAAIAPTKVLSNIFDIIQEINMNPYKNK